jgi:hypothetical protein
VMPRRSPIGDELDSMFATLARIAYGQFPRDLTVAAERVSISLIVGDA